MWFWTQEQKYLKNWAQVAHAYNPSYLGGW
jgi:hypothetical protein